MGEMINLVQTLKDEVAQLRRVLAMNIRVGDAYPGGSQVERIKSLIDDLEREIAAHRGPC
jgi:hypothetical protein